MTNVGEDREEQGERRGGPGIRLNIGSLEAPDGSDNTPPQSGHRVGDVRCAVSRCATKRSRWD